MTKFQQEFEANDLFKKLEAMPLPRLMILCSTAIEEKLEPQRLDLILMMLESKLSARRMQIRLGLGESE